MKLVIALYTECNLELYLETKSNINMIAESCKKRKRKYFLQRCVDNKVRTQRKISNRKSRKETACQLRKLELQSESCALVTQE